MSVVFPDPASAVTSVKGLLKFVWRRSISRGLSKSSEPALGGSSFVRRKKLDPFIGRDQNLVWQRDRFDYYTGRRVLELVSLKHLCKVADPSIRTFECRQCGFFRNVA